MIQMQSCLGVADNSGAKKVMCIKILGGSHHNIDGIGAVIVVSIREASPNGKVKAGDVCKAVIVRSKYGARRKDGSKIRFDSNDVVILNSNLEPIGSRVFGPIPRELRSKSSSFGKIVSLADEVI